MVKPSKNVGRGVHAFAAIRDLVNKLRRQHPGFVINTRWNANNTCAIMVYNHLLAVVATLDVGFVEDKPNGRFLAYTDHARLRRALWAYNGKKE